MAGDEVRVQGRLVSWASNIFKLNGVRYYGVTAVNWDQSRERVLGYGQNRSGLPRGQTAGKYVPGVLKVKMFKDTAIQMRKDLASLAPDGKSYGEVEVPATNQVAEGTFNSTAEFIRCSVAKETPGVEESGEPTQEEWEFTTHGILTDGLSLFNQQQV
jgi:hypothetical protein